MAQININVNFDDDEILQSDALKLYTVHLKSDARYLERFYEIDGRTYSVRTINDGDGTDWVDIALWNPNIIKVD